MRGAVLALCALAGATASARGVTPEDLIGLIDIGIPAVSPDGRSIAIETRHADLERNRTIIRWLIIDRRSTETGRVVNAGDGGEPILFEFRGLQTGVSLPQRPQWSPNSQWIAYRVLRAGGTQVWRSRRDGTREQQLTHSAYGVESFCWSRDGAALIYVDSPARQAFEQALHLEADRGYLYDARFIPFQDRGPVFDPGPDAPRATHYQDLATGVERAATPDEARECEPLVESFFRDLRADKAIGVNPPLTIVAPDPSIAGRSVVCRATECSGYFSGAWLSEDGRSVRFLRWTNGRQYGPLALYRWIVGQPRVSEQWRTDDLLQHCEHDRGTLLCAHESATTPRRLVQIDLNTGRGRRGPFTDVYDANPQFRSLSFGNVTPFIWRDLNGVDGFAHLVKPLGYESGRRYPLIIVQYRSRGFLRGGVGDEYPIHVFSANGFAVLSFERPSHPDLEALARDYDDLEALHGEDLRDRRRVQSQLLAALDALEELGLIDPKRVGITGLSDGGETVAYALATVSSRFAAAATSWTSPAPTYYYVAGLKLQSQFTRWHFGDPRGADAEQWQRGSLALNAQSVVTPLLVQVSALELLPETETVAALQAQAKPVEMYVFPGEPHIKGQPRHRLHIYRRNLQWFQFWLQGVEAADPLDVQQYDRWRALRALNQTSAATHARSESN